MVASPKTTLPSPPVPTPEDPLPGLRGTPPPMALPRVEGGPWRNILVRLPNWVGDAVLALPALRAIRESFREARITILIRPHLFPIFSSEPYFDAYIPDRARSPGSMVKAARELAAERFDLGLVFPHSIGSSLVLGLGRVPVRVGYSERWIEPPLLLTHPLRAPKEAGFRQIPMVDYYLNLAYAVGCRPSSRRITFHIPDELQARWDALLREMGIRPGERWIGLSPGASFGASKLWRSDRFAEVADALAREFRARILILCGPGEESVADDIENTMEEPAVSTSRRIVPLDILKPVVKRLMLLVCTDSGARHFATGTGVPAVVVMGSTYHAYTETEYEKYEIVHHRLDCWPCHRPVCPLGHHQCMRDLPPSRVLDACRRMLARFPPDSSGAEPR